MDDPFDLNRFIDAQAPVYARVVEELRRGCKQSHWMWFVFPQVAGLGASAMAVRFAISGRAEAATYLTHPVLGPRLHECTRLVLAVSERAIEDIFGYPDTLKFRSSMTLFASAAVDNADFVAALDKYYGGKMDGATLERLA